jgi:hypothetical protein
MRDLLERAFRRAGLEKRWKPNACSAPRRWSLSCPRFKSQKSRSELTTGALGARFLPRAGAGGCGQSTGGSRRTNAIRAREQDGTATAVLVSVSKLASRRVGMAREMALRHARPQTCPLAGTLHDSPRVARSSRRGPIPRWFPSEERSTGAKTSPAWGRAKCSRRAHRPISTGGRLSASSPRFIAAPGDQPIAPVAIPESVLGDRLEKLLNVRRARRLFRCQHPVRGGAFPIAALTTVLSQDSRTGS